MMEHAYRKRRREAAWCGLYGAASNLVSAPTKDKRDDAAKRIVRYVETLRALGVVPTPTEREEEL